MSNVSWHKEPIGVLIAIGKMRVRISVVDESIIHVVCTERETFSAVASLMVVPQLPTICEWSVLQDDGELLLVTARLRLRIHLGTGAFTWEDPNGNLLVREPSTGGRSLEEIPVERREFDADAETSTVATADGLKSRTSGGRAVFDRTAYTTRTDFVFSPGEAIYGLGQHEEGILNYRGHSQSLYQHNMKVAMPVIVSTRGYGVLWDTNGFAAFHDDEHGSYFWTEVDDELDFYFLAGPELDDVMAGLRKLTGAPTMFPRWAYGYIQSKERYVDQDELIAVVQEYRLRGIPIDCIVLDWQSWEGENWGQKTLDPSRFSDPERLSATLHELNAKWMISIWPTMRNNCENQRAMREIGGLLGDGATYNAFDHKARKLYWAQAHDGLFRLGVDAWWCDCSEPFESDWHGLIKPEPSKRIQVNVGEARTYLDPEYLNAYSLLHSRGIYEGQRGATQEKRVLNLTRSGFPGQQRYGAITWSGDTSATWETLRRQIADGLNFCATGNPRWTLDVGGFFVQKREQWFWRGDYQEGCNDLGYRELYTRWLQLATFLPMLRSHGTDTPREVWQFGEPGEQVYDTLVRFIKLRYRLLPYIYALSAAEAQDNYTMFRMLAFDFRADPNVYNIRDQFMFGPALLVAPVTNPMDWGPRSQKLEDIPHSRSVYLPAGADWYDFWTGACYHGGQAVTAPANLDIIPLFVRAGSVLVLGPEVQHTGEDPESPLELRLYAGASGKFVIYDDSGDGYEYEHGLYSKIELQWDGVDRKLSIGDRRGAFPGMKTVLQFALTEVSSAKGIGSELPGLSSPVITYTGKRTDYSFSE